MSEDTVSYLAEDFFSLQTGKKSSDDVQDQVSDGDLLSLMQFAQDDFQSQETKCDQEEPEDETDQDQSEQNPGNTLVSQQVSEPKPLRVPSFVGGLLLKMTPTLRVSKDVKEALISMHMENKIKSPSSVRDRWWTEYLQGYFGDKQTVEGWIAGQPRLVEGIPHRFDHYYKAFMTAHKRFVYDPIKNHKVMTNGTLKKRLALDADAIIEEHYCGGNAEMAKVWFQNVSEGLKNSTIEWLFTNVEAKNLLDKLRNAHHVRKVIDSMHKRTLDDVHSKISKKMNDTLLQDSEGQAQTENTKDKKSKQSQTADANKLSALCFYHHILRRGLANSFGVGSPDDVGLRKIIAMIERLLTQEGKSQTGIRCLEDFNQLLQANKTELQSYPCVFFETED